MARDGSRRDAATGFHTIVYLDYYGLREAPFSLTPNPRFLYYGGAHREAFNHLLFGIRERKGFVQLTGDVGAGKTTVCRAILEALEPHIKTALILNPVLDANDLLRAVLAEFEFTPSALDRYSMMESFNAHLIEQARAGNECVLFIDEAQNLSDDLMEQVRLLSNLETDDRKLLQIVLMGQPELRVRLDAPQLRQLRQRIQVRYHLGPLHRTEIGQYVQHRLAAAGGVGRPRFTAGALWRIRRYSGGVPRLVNALCDRALLAGFVQQEQVITFRTVGRAIRELEGHLHR